MTKKNRQIIIPRVGRMHSPPHPGRVLSLLHLKPANVSVTDFAAQLGVDRKTISRLVNGRCGVTAEMALRLGKALGTTPDLWLGLQLDHDLWHAARAYKSMLTTIKPIPRPTEGYQPTA